VCCAKRAPEDWTVRRAEPTDRDRAIALLDRTFGSGAIDAQLWDWIFVRNPARAGMYYVVAETKDGRFVGQYAAMPIRIVVGGDERLALLSLHTATDPDFGGRGIFTQLARALYEQASEEATLVYGFPNANSAPGFYRKLRWVDLRPYPRLVRPLSAAARSDGGGRVWSITSRAAIGTASVLLRAADARRSARGRRRQLELVPLDRFADWADELWSELIAAAGASAVRDSAFLNWRYVDCPRSYERLVATLDGAVAGFVVFGIDTERRRAFLMELEARPDHSDVAGALLAAATRKARAAGARVLETIATPRHPHWRLLLQSGFLPDRRALEQLGVRRSVAPSFGVRLLRDDIQPNAVLHVADWYLSGADADWV
jgi:GNAT superfamily N-acetyltransferase